MRTALLSVYYTQGIIEFAKELIELDWRIMASGKTARVLINAGIEIINISDLVNRVISRNINKDLEELKKIDVPRIDLVCADLYPIRMEIDRIGSTQESILEKIDIDGAALLRSASKGRRIVICDFADRKSVIDWLKSGEIDRENFINRLLTKAEYVVANDCLISASFLSNDNYYGFLGQKNTDCDYGENAWQRKAELFSFGIDDPLSLDKFKLVQGNSLSYNNYCDIDRLLQTFTHISAVFMANFGISPNIALAVKHGNSCGVSVSAPSNKGMPNKKIIADMIDGDPRAVFGGAIMTNFLIQPTEAAALVKYRMPKGKRILDVIVAPFFSVKAKDILRRKKDKCKLLENRNLLKDSHILDEIYHFRYVRGGFLRQKNYDFVISLQDARIKKFGVASSSQEIDMLLAWAIGSTSNSNTTTIVRNGKLLGNSAGQQSRVESCELAVKKARDAGHELNDAVVYTDSFFPFADGPRVLFNAGIKTILAYSGSARDKEIIDFCEDRKIVLYMIPVKIGRGFFGH